MELDEIKKRYPPEKPVCFNYMLAREDIFSLSAIIEQQRREIKTLQTKIKEWLKPSER